MQRFVVQGAGKSHTGINQTMIIHATESPKIPNPMVSGEETEIIQSLCLGRSCVLEIGTYMGITTANILHTGANVVSIDVSEVPKSLAGAQSSGECLPPALIGSSIPPELREKLELKVYNPNDPNGLQNLLRDINRKFDLIMIDGDHSYHGVSTDYLECTPFLSDIGIMIFHDCWWDVDPMPVEGPMRLLDEIGGIILSKTHIGMAMRDLPKLKLCNP